VAIKKDQDAYMMVMKEAQNYPAEKVITLDKPLLTQQAKTNGCSKPFQQKLNTIDSVESFTTTMQKDTVAFQQNPTNIENSEQMNQWIQLLSG
jgi:hypothetical protein